MKSNTFASITTLVLFIIGLVIFNSCSKSSEKISSAQTLQLEEFNPNQEDMIPLITTFNDAYKNHKLGYKSGEDIPLNEALWTLEAGVNYEFRSLKDSLMIVAYEDITITLSIEENEEGVLIVNNDDLFSNYESLILFTENTINSNGETSKLLFADLSIESYSESEAEMVMTAGIGQPKPRRCYVQTDDYWYAANELGPCPGGQAQTGILDAAMRIDQLLDNRHCSSPTCPGGGSVTQYLSIETIALNWNYTLNEWYFWNGEFDNECLDPDDITYWWGKAESEIENHRPTGKSFMYVSFEASYSVNWEVWAHIAAPIYYGIPDCTGSGGGTK